MTKLPISYLLLFLCCALIGSAGGQDAVPITNEKNHQLAISNDDVRVFKVEVPPKTETLFHKHDFDYVYVAIGASDVTSIRPNEKPVSALLRDGEVGFSRGGFVHKAVNNGDEPFDNVTVEFLKGAGKVTCGTAETHPCSAKGKDSASRRNIVLLDTDRLSVRSVQIMPDSSLGSNELGNRAALIVPTSDMDVETRKAGAVSYGMILLGEPRWFSPGEARTVKNSGMKEARVILIEFK